MTDLSRLANMAGIFSAIVVVGGIIFAVLQMRQTRQQRRELAAIELFRSFGSPYAFEWFQWLAMQLEDMQDDTIKPAYESKRDWKPLNLSNEI